MYQALEDAGAGTAVDGTLAALEKLEPPQRYQADHEVMLVWVRELVSLDREVGRSVADEDAVALAMANMALGRASARGLLSLSSPVCEAASLLKGDATDPRCRRLGPGEGGAYGAELYRLMSGLETEFRPRTTILVPPFAFDALFEVLARVKPDVVRVLKQTAASVRSMQPPAEYEQDHARLLGYLEEDLQAAQAIPDTPPDISLSPEGSPRVTVGPPPGGGAGPSPGGPSGPPPGRSASMAYCGAREAFSEEFSQLVVVHFGDREGSCVSVPPE